MKKYHHGDLKNTLITEGLKMLNDYGIEGFSLRKVSANCNVSHTALYKHFKNKDEFINAISQHVNQSFAAALQEAKSSYTDIEEQMVAIGVHYVMFMVNNPDYYNHLFSKKYHFKVEIVDGSIEYFDDPVFHVFYTTFTEFMAHYNLPESIKVHNLIAMWAMVQGLSTLFSSTMTVNTDLEEMITQIIVQKLHLDV